MNASPKKLLPLIVFAIAVTSLFSVRPAQANFIETLQQVGANVVANGSGPIDLNGLNFLFSTSASNQAAIIASSATIQTCPTGVVFVDLYVGFTGPTSFGSGGGFLANFGSGDFVGITGNGGAFGVPQGYVSGAPLLDSMTFNNETFASMGLTPGTYVWSWGTGANQNFTLEIGSVPDGGSTVWLLGCALLGLVGLRRRLSC